MPDLAQEFSARLRAAIRECYALDYRPTRFEQMLDSSDAVSIAKSLIKSGELQNGLKNIKSLGRLDLAMEQIMLEPEFEALFTDDERQAAAWRLSQL